LAEDSSYYKPKFQNPNQLNHAWRIPQVSYPGLLYAKMFTRNSSTDYPNEIFRQNP